MRANSNTMTRPRDLISLDTLLGNLRNIFSNSCQKYLLAESDENKKKLLNEQMATIFVMDNERINEQNAIDSFQSEIDKHKRSMIQTL